MNENQEQNQNDQVKNNLDESSPDTTDVRDAIKRANETNPQESQSQNKNQQGQHMEPAAEAKLTPQEHADVNTVGLQITENVQMPSAAAPVEPQHVEQTVQQTQAEPQPVAQASIPVDHPMAPLYVQQPMPPTPKANRLGGVLISLLATIAFALVYAGLIAAIKAPYYTPAAFLQEGLLPYVTSLGFVFPTVAFLVMMIIMVLIFNRAGWWVYAVLGFLIAIVVWGAAGAGYSLSPQLLADTGSLAEASKKFDISNMTAFAVTLPSFLAAIAAREVAVWFGAWIGSRGQKIKQANAAADHEYDQKMAEVQARVS